jgi:hypothetical protein
VIFDSVAQRRDLRFGGFFLEKFFYESGRDRGSISKAGT